MFSFFGDLIMAMFSAEAFDRKAFDAQFAKSLRRICAAEKITREVLMVLSRTVLDAIHSTGDIGWANRLIAVLTPVNKRVARLYFKEFSGFRFDEESMLFTKKSGKAYDKAKAVAQAFLEDPLNNLWTWSDRHVEVEKKPFDIKGVTQFMTRALKKAGEEGISQVDVMNAVIKAGVTADTIIACMDALGYEAKVEGETVKV